MTPATAKVAQSSLAKLRAEKAAYLAKAAIPTVMVLEEMDKPRPTYLLKRGQYDAPDKSHMLDPGVPEFLPPLPSGVPANRLGLARWLVDPANPLVARVEVNRLWQRFFGQGIVTTPDNLGSQGEPPANPELARLAGHGAGPLAGWDLKALEKEIVMSATYRQSSVDHRRIGEARSGEPLVGPRSATSVVGRGDSR